ncbi:hypothetical protein UFOVP237_62 [uncultured Caudovirales phage]|uniref:Uncharacterized protein n=1 Tax=uncultured Caudovirales phage TaxID=2100421 RepID=A0A6J7WTB5_9CAUD|nr:hypothetical protein UFOVP237_62 [uncultured Caudovirales phage]
MREFPITKTLRGDSLALCGDQAANLLELAVSTFLHIMVMDILNGKKSPRTETMMAAKTISDITGWSEEQLAGELDDIIQSIQLLSSPTDTMQ